MSARKHDNAESFFHPFGDLKKIIETKGISLSAAPSVAPKPEKTVSDEEAFVIAMKEVKEIKEFRSMPVKKRKAVPFTRGGSPDEEALKALEELVAGTRPVNLADTQEYVEWADRDYRHDILRMLREGRFSVQDTLDLHGYVLEEAEAEVERFMKEALNKGLRCVKIIHGRGLRSPCGPVLKEALLRWLSFRYRKNLLAFVTARQCDGGLGALYVLLK
jgi:DNA-nicking Smr family endonuclease